MKTRQWSILLALLLCGSLLLIGVQATGVGTLGVLATDMEDLPVTDLTVCIACVANEDGVLTEAFSGANIPADQLLDTNRVATNAKNLYRYAKKQGIEGTKLLTDASGKASFENLSRSIYLVWAGEGADVTFTPFLVFMPDLSSGEESWLILATLKISDHPVIPDDTKPVDPSLPQTGIDKIPMYLLGVFGALFIVLGAVLIFYRKGRKGNE